MSGSPSTEPSHQPESMSRRGFLGRSAAALAGVSAMAAALSPLRDLDPDDLPTAEEFLQKHYKEMTPEERADPKIINASRRLRIANGSGVKVSDVNQLVDRFFEARKMMAAMAGRMGGGGHFRR